MPIGPQKRSNAGKPRKRTHPARPKSRFEEAIDRVAGGNSRTAPDAAFGFPAKQCAAVACSGNPSRLARPRDEIGLPVVGSAGVGAVDHHAEHGPRTHTPARLPRCGGQENNTTLNYVTNFSASNWQENDMAL